MYKVLLVDDEILVREAISAKIEWEQIGFELVGDCEKWKGRDRVCQRTSGRFGIDRYLYALYRWDGAEQIFI